LAEEEAEF
jgi:hypothetical protein